MLNSIKDLEITKKIFQITSDKLGIDLIKLTLSGDEKSLSDTKITQPLILSTNYVFLKIFQENFNIDPSLLIGHSLGEYSALLASNILSFEDAVNIVIERSIAMSESVEGIQTGISAILGPDLPTVENICNECSNEDIFVDVANINAKNQIVIAGNLEKVEEASQRLSELKAKIIPLKMSVPAHCKLMKPASFRLQSFLNKFEFNTFDRSNVLHNANCKIEADTTIIKNLLVKQLYLPVNWVKLIDFSQNHQINNYIEIGPGRVLFSLTKKLISKTDKIANFNSLDSIDNLKGMLNGH
jgi:[acyl-carrier-protein] S-malonyltransferase